MIFLKPVKIFFKQRILDILFLIFVNLRRFMLLFEVCCFSKQSFSDVFKFGR